MNAQKGEMSMIENCALGFINWLNTQAQTSIYLGSIYSQSNAESERS
jgi:hypothetical protein